MALKLKGSTSGFVAIDAPSVAGNNTLILPENTGSAHQILANDITAGVTTFTQVTVSRNGDLTVPGTISIGGTLTYEDVTSVDSVGIVTARGLSIFGNTTGLQVASGISTFQAVTGTTGAFTGDVSIADKIIHTGDTDTAIRFPAADTITAETGGSERLRIDGSGYVLIGTSSSRTTRSGASAYNGSLQIESAVEAALTMTRFGSTHPARLNLQHARGTIASIAAAQNGDNLGQITFSGWDGDTFTNGAEIISNVDETPGDDDMPGNLLFKTTPNGFATPVERLRITHNGNIGINTTITTSVTKKLDIATEVSSDGIRIRSKGATYNDITISSDRTGGNQHLGRVVAQWDDTPVAYMAFNTGADTSNKDDGEIFFATSDGSGTSRKVTINSAGQVLVGNYASGFTTKLVAGTGSGENGITIYGGTSNNTYLHFADGTSGSDRYRGYVNYSHSDNSLQFGTNDGERMRITSGGHIGFNVTAGNWDSTFKAIEGGGTSKHGSLHFQANGDHTTSLGCNHYYNGGWKYRHAGKASWLEQKDDSWHFRVAGVSPDSAGSADGAITWREKLTLTDDHETILGITASVVTNTYSNSLRFKLHQTNGQSATLAGITAQGKAAWGGDLVFYTKSANSTPNDTITERMRIRANGETIFGDNIDPDTREPFLIEEGGTFRRLYPTNQGSGLHFTNGSVMPTRYDGVYLNGSGNLGNSSYKFGEVWASDGTINTSDRNTKNTIQNSDLGLDFILKLTPVSYKKNEGTSGRTHYGLISQDVEDVLADIGKTGKDFAGFCKDKKFKIENDADGNDVKTELDGYDYSLRYDQFISPLVKAVQELSAENTALKARLDAAGL